MTRLKRLTLALEERQITAGSPGIREPVVVDLEPLLALQGLEDLVFLKIPVREEELLAFKRLRSLKSARFGENGISRAAVQRLSTQHRKCYFYISGDVFLAGGTKPEYPARESPSRF
ncbi:MAG TPA: hypothetical protein VM452_19675 [Caulifigura sp.]|nr:hypothetical protein [Caulifigura sp.]